MRTWKALAKIGPKLVEVTTQAKNQSDADAIFKNLYGKGYSPASIKEIK